MNGCSFGIQNLVDVAGAISVCCFTLWMPFVLHFKRFGSTLPLWRKCLYVATILFGWLLAGAGLYFSIDNIIKIKNAQLFEGPCHENAYYIGCSTLAVALVLICFWLGAHGAYSDSTDTVFYNEIYLPTCGPQGDIAIEPPTGGWREGFVGDF